MAASSTCFLSFFFFIFALVVVNPTQAQLTPHFYKYTCPQAFPIIRSVVFSALRQEARMGASLLRLHFHDCFVNGCDGSILLDDTPTFIGEKTALPNNNSVRGFNVVDEIKSALNKACGNVVSCADILAVAARDSVNLLGGPWYNVLVGRRDSTTASRSDANVDLPAPFFNLSQLVSNFQSHGLDLTDLVALSGGHTIGLARCTSFQARAYNDTNINGRFAAQLRNKCPPTGGANITQPLDPTTNFFDTAYFKALPGFKGLLHSDQELFKDNGSGTDKLVLRYIKFPYLFYEAFINSMIKMGNLKPLTGTAGQIRLNCRVVN